MRSLAARQSALGTAFQVLPKFRQVLANLQPTWHLRDIATIDADFVGRHGITGMIWDVDGTLTVHHADRLAAPCRAAFADLLQLTQIDHVILSNAGEARFRELSRIFPTLPVHQGYRVGDELLLRTRRGEADAWDDSKLRALLADGAIPVRKPDAALVESVVRAMGRRSEEVVMVGDQYFTDIAGANLAGIRSIKVPTFARSRFPLAVRMAQHAEGLLYRLQHGAPVWEAPSATISAAREGR